MKSHSKLYRQGDVLLLRVDDPPAALGQPIAREHGAVVLAHGEVTGHSHQIKARGAQLYALEANRLTGEEASQAIARLGGGLIPDRMLKLGRAAQLVHEEHATIRLPAGYYIVRVQREYSPQALRSVAD